MIVPQMARHAAGFHPMSYTVWYEYHAGLNPKLNTALDACLRERNSLTDADIIALFDKFVAPRDAEATAKASAEIARLVKEVDSAATLAGKDVRLYGDELDGYRRKLQSEIGPEQLDEVVQSLILDTSRVRTSTETFYDHLRRNSQEVEQLRAELAVAQGLALQDPADRAAEPSRLRPAAAARLGGSPGARAAC